MKPLYLDYAATTPIAPEVFAAMQPYFTDPLYQGNPAASHDFGQNAQAAVEHARGQVAAFLKAKPQEIIFTSGATEANHLAILGATQFYQSRGRHVVLSAIEHASIRALGEQMGKLGFEVTLIKPQRNGQVAIADMLNALRDDTVLVSLMLVNNETGVMQNVAELTQHLKGTQIKVHCDATQAAGKIPLDVNALGVDYLSISAHKFYGPKGVGSLYVRAQPKARLVPLFFGGRHEQGLRAGTLPTPQIVGMGEACQWVERWRSQDSETVLRARDKFWQALTGVGGVELNGDLHQQVPHILNFSIAGVKNDMLLQALPRVALSKGAACHSNYALPSPVLMAMGLSIEQAHQAVRVSFGRYLTMAEIDEAVARLIDGIKRLRKER